MTFAECTARAGVYVKKVTDSPWYVPAVNIIILISWASGVFYIGFVLFVAALLAIFMTQKNLNAALPFFAGIIFIVSDFGNKHGHAAMPDFYADFAPVLYVCLPFLLGALVWFYIRNKFKFKIGPLGAGIIAVFAVLPFGGAGARPFSFADLLMILIYFASIFGAYVFFYNALDTKEAGFKKLFCRVFLYAALVVASQVFIAYLRHTDIDGTVYDFHEYFARTFINLGWGIGTTAGNMMTVFLPFVFYLIYKAENKREAVLYNLAVFYVLLALFYTKSRASMLGLICVLPALYIVSLRRAAGKGVRKTGLISLAAAGAALLFVFLLFRETVTDYVGIVLKAGASDPSSGRYTLYADAWRDFLSNPLFGKSVFYWPETPMYVFSEQGSIFMYWYHNTFLQIIANLGLFGLAAFSFFMYRKYAIYFKRKGDALKFYILMSFIATEICGMVDMNVVTLIYSIQLVLLASVGERVEPEDKITDCGRQNILINQGGAATI